MTDAAPRLAAELGLPLLLAVIASGLGCATQEETADPFQPPVRPLIYRGSGDCPSVVKPQPSGPLASSIKLPTLEGGPAEGPIVVSHGGVGSPPSVSDGPRAAAKAGLDALQSGGSALDAAVQATVKLEDDPRFNAGTGANIRIDGKTIQMDASLMTGDGTFAAVAAIERVRNPILVARKVLETPHLLLVGEGATRFAHKVGFKDEVPWCKEAEAKYKERVSKLKEVARQRGKSELDYQALWNFPNPLPEALRSFDTVGTVVRDKDGRFAMTLSTGGTSLTLYGRVGDVPMFGAGGYAGPAGAVACTGDGELIVRQLLARSVYEQIAAGVSARVAVHRAVAEFPKDGTVGIIAVDAVGWGVAANRPMAFGTAIEMGRSK